MEIGKHVKNGKVQYSSGATRSSDAEDFRFDLISPIGLRRLAKRYAAGAKNHGPRNWEAGMPISDILNHLELHLNLWKSGDRTDDHFSAIAWGAFAILHYEETLPELFTVTPAGPPPATEQVEHAPGQVERAEQAETPDALGGLLTELNQILGGLVAFLPKRQPEDAPKRTNGSSGDG